MIWYKLPHILSAQKITELLSFVSNLHTAVPFLPPFTAVWRCRKEDASTSEDKHIAGKKGKCMRAERHLCADFHRVLDWSVRVRIQSFPGVLSLALCTLLLSSNFCFLELLSLWLWGMGIKQRKSDFFPSPSPRLLMASHPLPNLSAVKVSHGLWLTVNLESLPNPGLLTIVFWRLVRLFPQLVS